MSSGGSGNRGGVAGEHPRRRLSLFVAPTSSGDHHNTLAPPLAPVGCWRLEAARFDFDSSVVRPEAKAELTLLAALVKGLLPAIIMTLCGLMSLLMTPDKFNQRLSLATSSLLGTVIYHLTITSAIPPVAYLTFADRFMIGNYSCMLLTVATTMLLMRYLDRGDAARTEWVRVWGLRTVPLLWLGLQIVNLLQL